jgi:hypothetical protein
MKWTPDRGICLHSGAGGSAPLIASVSLSDMRTPRNYVAATVWLLFALGLWLCGIGYPRLFWWYVLGASVLFCLYTAYCGHVDRRYGFRLKGGRGGVIEYQEGPRIAQISWEGLQIGIAVSLKNARWVFPLEGPMSDEDRNRMLALFDSWCRAKGEHYCETD